jgi:hypothetical protein
MERRNPSPDRDSQKQIEQSSSDASSKKISLEQHMRMFGQKNDQQAYTNEAFTSELDGQSTRQTEDCSSECKEVSVLPNVWDKGKYKLSPDEERWLKSIPMGENGQRVPRVELSTTFTPDRLILVGGGQGRNKSS